jgi:hypothetical protein
LHKNSAVLVLRGNDVRQPLPGLSGFFVASTEADKGVGQIDGIGSLRDRGGTGPGSERQNFVRHRVHGSGKSQ